MASTDAKVIAIKNQAYRVTFPILDADGDLVTGAATLDSEVSIDGGTFADCTNEATEIATGSGVYFLDLTASEMNGDTIAVIVKTSTAGAKTTVLAIPTAARNINDLAFPTVSGRSMDVDASGGVEIGAIQAGAITAAAFAAGAIDAAAIATDAIGASEFAQGAADKIWASASRALTDKIGFRLATEVRNGTAQAGAAGTITLDAGASATDDLYNGLWIVLTGGTGAGQARLVSDYVGATKVASVVPNWTTAPDATSVFTLLPAGAADVRVWLGTAVNALIAGRVDANTQAMGADVIGAAQLATDAIGAAEFSQAAADKVWASATRTLTSFGTLVADVATAVWGAGTRTLTAFSTGLALSVWDVLESAIATASSIGLKLKTNLDVVLSTRAPEAGGNIAAIRAKTDLQPEGIRKNVALPNFAFLMVQSGDHVTPATGLTVTGTRSIDGGAFAALTNAVVEVANGIYRVDLAAADTNGDVITYRFTATGGDARLITVKTSP